MSFTSSVCLLEPSDVHRAPEPAPIQGVVDPERVCPMSLQRYLGGELQFNNDLIAVEEELLIRVAGHSEFVLARTPGDDINLITGCLYTRGLIRRPEDIVDISLSGKNGSIAEVVHMVAKPVCVPPTFTRRGIQLELEQFFVFKRAFEKRQKLFKNTGATHAAALMCASGELLAYGEDVSRHNAFDKAIGRALRQGFLGKVAVALLSSRLALESVAKASAANIPILCGFSAATSSAIEFAARKNITLVGRIRKDTFNVYANGWRIQRYQ